MEIPSLVLLSRSDVLERQLEVVSNNIANAATTGFKAQRSLFQTYISRPSAANEIQYVVDRGTFTDFSQGPISTTGNPLDVAIQGDGYVAVQGERGTAYTRNGAWTLNEKGEIITSSGDRVLGAGGAPLVIPEEATDISITADGTVRTSIGDVGKLEVVKFANEKNLKPLGNNLYESAEPGAANEEARFVQGALESSNVQTVIELTQVMEISRNYQQTQKLIEQENERQRSAIRTLARVTA